MCPSRLSHGQRGWKKPAVKTCVSTSMAQRALRTLNLSAVQIHGDDAAIATVNTCSKRRKEQIFTGQRPSLEVNGQHQRLKLALKTHTELLSVYACKERTEQGIPREVILRS
jgi:hypothetical protein